MAPDERSDLLVAKSRPEAKVSFTQGSPLASVTVSTLALFTFEAASSATLSMWRPISVPAPAPTAAPTAAPMAVPLVFLPIRLPTMPPMTAPAPVPTNVPVPCFVWQLTTVSRQRPAVNICNFFIIVLFVLFFILFHIRFFTQSYNKFPQKGPIASYFLYFCGKIRNLHPSGQGISPISL